MALIRPAACGRAAFGVPSAPMIRFSNVRGDVFVDDRRKDDRVMAYDGLALDAGGDYLVATTQTSSAQVLAYGKTFRLAQYSFLRLNPSQVREGTHNEFWWAPLTKLFLAKLWALAGGRM
jgi:hypothetical protein